MKYTAKQIENARKNYNKFLQYTTATQESCYEQNPNEAERRAEFHNNIVKSIINGDKELERKWKMFFLNEELRKGRKEQKRKEKLAKNKAESEDVLAPIKKMRKIGAFGKWLNTSGNPFRKQHFNKCYTQGAVNAFLETLKK